MPMSTLICLEPNKQSPGCLRCTVNYRGWCPAFKGILRKIAGNLKKQYSGIPPQDREEILANVVIGVLGGVERFEGRRGAKFSTWVWQIYRNKTIDFFRAKTPQADIFVDFEKQGAVNPLDEAETKIAIAECFKKHLPDDTTGCIRLYLDLYRFFQKGRAQKDLADRYGLNPNTLNQRIARCRKTIRIVFRSLVE